MLCNPETAALLIIGDEILNGSIVDRNIPFLTYHLFSRGLKVTKIEVIGDHLETIINSMQRLQKEVKYIFTTGGLGPTHDDITFLAIAASYHCPISLHLPSKLKLQKILSRYPHSPTETNSTTELVNEKAQMFEGTMEGGEEWMTEGRLRMCTLPSLPPPFDTSVEISGKIRSLIFTRRDRSDDPSKANVIKYHEHDNVWAPLVEINQQTFILPGVPSLLEHMYFTFIDILPLNSLHKTIKVNVYSKQHEGDIATILSDAQSLCENVAVGSYPLFVNSVNTNAENNITTKDKMRRVESVQIRICVQSSDLSKIQQVVAFLKSNISDCQDSPFVFDANDNTNPSLLSKL